MFLKCSIIVGSWLGLVNKTHCSNIFSCQGEEDWRQVEQTVVLLKTLYLFSTARLDVYIITNDPGLYNTILEAVKEWNTRLSLHQRAVLYPPGLEDMMEMFRSQSSTLYSPDTVLSLALVDIRMNFTRQCALRHI